MRPGRNPTRSPAYWRLMALLAYPLLVLIALALGAPQLRALAMPLLALAIIGPGPMNGPRAGLLAGALVLTVAVLLKPALALWPPGLICLAAATWFGLSLRPGNTPLIERFAAAIHELDGTPRPDGSGPWLRGWTWLWTVLMTVIGVVALLLAALDWASHWLLWMLAVAPASIFSVLVLELLLRRRHFPEQTHPSVRRFLLDLAHIQPRHLAP